MPRMSTSTSPSFTSGSASTTDEEYEPQLGEVAAVTHLFREQSKKFPNAPRDGDVLSRHSKSIRLSPYLVGHHFLTMCGGRRGPYDGPLHESINFCLLVRGCRVFYRCFSPSCQHLDPYNDSRGCLGTLAPWLPGDAAFNDQKVFDLYQQAILRAGVLSQLEGPGDEPAPDGVSTSLPADVRGACRRDVLQYLNRFFIGVGKMRLSMRWNGGGTHHLA